MRQLLSEDAGLRTWPKSEREIGVESPSTADPRIWFRYLAICHRTTRKKKQQCRTVMKRIGMPRMTPVWSVAGAYMRGATSTTSRGPARGTDYKADWSGYDSGTAGLQHLRRNVDHLPIVLSSTCLAVPSITPALNCGQSSVTLVCWLKQGSLLEGFSKEGRKVRARAHVTMMHLYNSRYICSTSRSRSTPNDHF